MKTLVDTSAWIEFFKGNADPLEMLLVENNVIIHSNVIGELSCGNIKNRNKTLGNLKLLPKAKEASFTEAIELIDSRHLYGKGLGFSDVQLLASALISGSALFSFNKAVKRAALDLNIKLAE